MALEWANQHKPSEYKKGFYLCNKQAFSKLSSPELFWLFITWLVYTPVTHLLLCCAEVSWATQSHTLLWQNQPR